MVSSQAVFPRIKQAKVWWNEVSTTWQVHSSLEVWPCAVMEEQHFWNVCCGMNFTKASIHTPCTTSIAVIIPCHPPKQELSKNNTFLIPQDCHFISVCLSHTLEFLPWGCHVASLYSLPLDVRVQNDGPRFLLSWQFVTKLHLSCVLLVQI
jgi:hypothetical protein